jgi:signal transduction histidine kinase
MKTERRPDSQAVIDGLGQGTLLFDSNNRLVQHNQAARRILGGDMRAVAREGWVGALNYFDRRLSAEYESLNSIRTKALTSSRPVRFKIDRHGALVPCWAAAVHGQSGEVYTMITIEQPDWASMGELLRQYLKEANDAIDATAGHARLIQRSMSNPKANMTVEQIARRIGGFARIIGVHMFRMRQLTDMMVRWEVIRTDRLREMVGNQRSKVLLEEFLSEFMESLGDTPLVDPETSDESPRPRIKIIVPANLYIVAAPHYLSLVLRDILRNAIMYSMRATPVYISIHEIGADDGIQIDVTDEGYGIRRTEYGAVFEPFVRAKQPEIIGEFGYGLSLYLCKHEVEAMGGRLWFKSDEGHGTTFSMKFPAWREDAALSDSVSSGS